eukprot:CAMPEP_0113698514 /NCGR_PEP_ID=MMETSP0038_2-20120614/22754_1 /TAXON_ID=2898 /ORGANISM="Cryptomonas paramecium" /LENGTH=332 /DNA_ID=CAMNT_0000621689 /DNA_START=183 /DNA_END=1178 /DNA_ORIENTATION=- /assembly_acc=CAM_ASM_000170
MSSLASQLATDAAFLAKFKDEPKKAIQSLIDKDQIQRNADVVASLFISVPGLDEAGIGDYVGDGDPFCAEVLKCYAGRFQLQGLGFDDALRKFLSAFRLPGESQKIERIVNAFAQQYHKQNPRTFRAPDTAWVLAYSLIMLNTDAHNASVRRAQKMTKEQFVRNNRGIDDGKDLPRDLLESMYDRIVANAISMQPFKNDSGDASIITYTNPQKAGWMRKRWSDSWTWNARWFVLKGSCLYFLRKPPVWGAPCELCGHIALQSELVARKAEVQRDADQGHWILETQTGASFRAGKIDRRAGTMKTSMKSQLRLIAQNRDDMEEWVGAVNANIA